MHAIRYLLAIALALSTGHAAAQAVSALPAASTLTGAELTIAVQGGTTKKATIDQIKTWASNAPTLVTPALGTPASGNFSTGTFTWPTFNQSTTGSAATLTTPRAIYGNNFDGTAALTQIIASPYGGTGNGFTKFTGPTTAERTFTLPDSSATLLYSGGAAGTPSSITLTNGTALPSAGITMSTARLLGRTTASSGAAEEITVGAGLSLSAGTLTATGGSVAIGDVTGLGTNVATALGVAVGSDGAFVTRGGNAGTPSALVCTNCTGTASGLTAGTVTTNANLTGDVTSSGNATTLATVNSNVGSFTNSSITVNGKGLITAASSGAAGATLGANTFTALQTITQASANAGILASTGYSLTGSDATGMVNLAGTWNTTGTPTAFKLNITNTASNAASLLMDLQVGGNTTLSVYKGSGAVSANTMPTLRFGGYLGDVYVGAYAGILTLASTSTMTSATNARIGPTDITLASTGSIGFASSTSSAIASGADTVLTRSAAATLQQGYANAASPVAQTLQAQGSRSGTDTNVGGANYTHASGNGTGTGTLSQFIISTPVAVASGTGAQTITPTLTLGNGVFTIGSNVVTPASSGTRYLCISTAGVVTSSASACSGT